MEGASGLFYNVGYHGWLDTKMFQLKLHQTARKNLIFLEVGNVNSQHK